MLTIRYETTFKKDFKRIVKRGYDIHLLEETVEILAKGEELPKKYKDHALAGDYADCRECHITPDWLLFCIDINILCQLLRGDQPLLRQTDVWLLYLLQRIGNSVEQSEVHLLIVGHMNTSEWLFAIGIIHWRITICNTY